MTKCKLVFCVAASFVAILSHQSIVSPKSLTKKRDVQMYTTKYDNIDVDAVLASERLLKNYVNCLLEKGSCTPEGKTLKQYLPDAVATGCTKCSETQKKIAGKVLGFLLLKHRDIYDEISAKYDPEGIFRKKYMNDDEDYSDLEQA